MKLSFLRKRATPEPIMVPDVVDPEDMDEEDRTTLRLIAQHEFQSALATRDRVLTEMVTSARWIQASLLLVNGGAAVAVLQGDKLAAWARVGAGTTFVAGIVLALLTAVLDTRVARDTPLKLSQSAGYWMSVAVDLLRSEEIEREWHEYATEVQSRRKWPQISGLLSLFAFLAGCGLIGVSLLS